jgi:hypothetical protein
MESIHNGIFNNFHGKRRLGSQAHYFRELSEYSERSGVMNNELCCLKMRRDFVKNSWFN